MIRRVKIMQLYLMMKIWSLSKGAGESVEVENCRSVYVSGNFLA